MASEIKVDTVSEKTSGSGVTIDGLLIKDGGISGDVSLIGTTPTFTIGDAGAEDAALVFDGNAQDFYIALDDSADDLLIGLGSTVGTTPAVSIDENLQVKIVATTASTSATTGSFIAAGGAGVAADLHVGDDVTLISDSAVLGFGADKDTTLTHTDGTGLTLNSTNKLCFNDATQFIQGASGTVLDIAATDEIELTATLTEVVGRLEVTNGAIFNEASADVDFRVESNGNDHMLFVDGGNDHVMIGTSSDLGGVFGVNGDQENQGNFKIKHTGDAPRILRLDANRGAGGDSIGDIEFMWNGNINAKISGIAGPDTTNKDDAHLDFFTRTSGASIARRMRIETTGDVGIGIDDPYAKLHVAGSGGAGFVTEFRGLASSGTDHISTFYHSAYTPDDNTTKVLSYQGNDDTVRFRVFSDGDVQNHDNSYGAISDERIKQNITDSGSQWDDIKAVKVRKYKKKDDVRKYGDNAWVQLGVIAQELETSNMDKLVRSTDPSASDVLSDSSFGTLYEDGDDIPEGKKIGDVKEVKTKVKGVNYSILYMKAIKALQEAQTRIETLESKVTALEG